MEHACYGSVVDGRIFIFTVTLEWFAGGGRLLTSIEVA
jgi:hypothetical protein